MDKVTETFGPIWWASGSRGFFTPKEYRIPSVIDILFPLSEKYPITLTAKTATLESRAGKPTTRQMKKLSRLLRNLGKDEEFIRERIGSIIKSCPANMPLQGDGITPEEWFPRCIHMGWRGIIYGTLLNSVGLSGPGLQALLEMMLWQEQEGPGWLSWMCVGPTKKHRHEERKAMVELLMQHREKFLGIIGLQENLSCPNVGLDPSGLIEEAHEACEDAEPLKMDYLIKINALVSPRTAKEMAGHPACKGIINSNSIPVGQLKERIDWKRLMGSLESPLAKRGFGPGGLSGKPLQPIVCDWIKEARDIGFEKHINACGGLFYPRDVDAFKAAGANSCSYATGRIRAPAHTGGVSRRAHELFA
jgi:dihydroorotate dehydrogenase